MSLRDAVDPAVPETLEPAPARPLRVLHIITRMILGGAQETAMLSCSKINLARFPSELLTGPETGSEGELHSECRRRGVKVHIEPSLVRRIHPWLDWLALVRITRFIRRGHYDIVHTHSSKAGILGRVAAKLAGTPIVIHTAHGWGFNDHQSRWVHDFYVWLERRCAGLGHALVVVGSPDRDAGLGLGIGRPAHYHLIRSGIEIERYRDVTITRDEARRRMGVPVQAFVVGTVGRLTPQKAPLDLLQAFAKLAAARPDAHLAVIGDGPQRALVEADIASRGLESRVHLLGLRHDVPELLRGIDVFALASRWEGLPRVFPQAMAAGLPIVATRIDGATDAVTPGETGWLVDVGDTDALAARWLDLASNPERARQMGERGRARAEEFSAARMLVEIEALYDRLAEERGLRVSTGVAS